MKQFGCLLIDKMPGITSAKLVGETKRKLGLSKLGHAGTLDKFASGLVLLLAGPATKLFQIFVGLDKSYRAKISFGSETATLDPEGEVVSRRAPPDLATIEQVLPQLLQQQLQQPPLFSALHVNGKRAYQRALSGEQLQLPGRAVKLLKYQINGWESNELDLTINCSSGYYVRSLARDLGRMSDSCAHLSALKRCAIGEFSLAGSSNLENISTDDMQSPLTLLKKIPACQLIAVDLHQQHLLTNGQLPAFDDLRATGYHVLHYQERLLAVVKKDENGKPQFVGNFSAAETPTNVR